MLLNSVPVDAFSTIVHRDKAYDYGKRMTEKLRELIPRQLFDVPIQAAIGGRIIARETVKAKRKDVHRQVLRRRHHAQAQAARAPEGGQEADEADRPRRGAPGGVRRRPPTRRLMTTASSAPFGVYVHIPFCAYRCDYCDFATWTDRAHLIDDVRRRVRPRPRAPRGAARRDERVLRRRHAVAARRAAAHRDPRRDPARRRRRGHRRVQPRLRRRRRSSRAYAAAGVNRVSFGVQSMRAARARRARPHPRSRQRRARGRRRRATPGFERINLDLIYGTPGESRRRLARPRSTARSRSSPTHVSAYALTVEPGTPLGRGGRGRAARRARRRRPGRRSTSSPTTVLAAAGLEWYEISNWARPGEECRHNLLYWAGRRVRRDRLRGARPHRPGAGGGTCARPSATSPRSPPARRPRPATRCSTPAPAGRGDWSLALRDPRRDQARRRRRPILSEWSRASTSSSDVGLLARDGRPGRPDAPGPAARQRGRRRGSSPALEQPAARPAGTR